MRSAVTQNHDSLLTTPKGGFLSPVVKFHLNDGNVAKKTFGGFNLRPEHVRRSLGLFFDFRRSAPLEKIARPRGI